MSEEKIVMRDSDEAASLKTVTGWVSRDGRFFGNDERTARYIGSTHQNCATSGCNGIVPTRGLAICNECREIKSNERYAELDAVEWDCETPLCIYGDDQYFFDDDDIYCYCDEHNIDPAKLKLVLCNPQYGRELEPDDFLIDNLDDYGSPLTDEVFKAAELFNNVVRGLGPLGWYPGNVAVRLPATMASAMKKQMLLERLGTTEN